MSHVSGVCGVYRVTVGVSCVPARPPPGFASLEHFPQHVTDPTSALPCHALLAPPPLDTLQKLLAHIRSCKILQLINVYTTIFSAVRVLNVSVTVYLHTHTIQMKVL